MSVEQGARNLRAIISDLGTGPLDWNEANTRFGIIDRLLKECLGWPIGQIRVEEHFDGEYRDYELGIPSLCIWEAKRSGAYFDFPADAMKRSVQTLEGIFSTSEPAEKAIRQVQTYCNASGVEFGIVCNGHQLVAFIAQRVGSSWLKGRALAIRSLEHMLEEFALIWQCLSPDGVFERRLFTLLASGITSAIPSKLSTQLFHFPAFRYKTDLQSTLRSISELLLEDVPATEGMRPRFYRECYCETGALSRDALISQELLTARYAALFPPSEDAPRLEPAADDKDGVSLTGQVVTEAMARRPIVLLGDVGVGKTSFLEDLMFVRAEKEFKNAIIIYIDLGSRAALSHDIRNYVISEIERQLYSKYGVDVYENNFVRGVYDLEVKRFRSSFKAHVYKSNKAKLDEQIMLRLAELTGDKPEHLRRSVEHVSLARRRQIVFMLDNSDQRTIEVQQEAFIVAQEFAQNWNSLVFLTARPQTFFQSKKSGALSAYPHKIFTIMPPRPEVVIEKRLIFALKIAEGQIPSEALSGVRLNIRNMASFLRALIFSLEKNRDLTEILANITGGNIRAVVEFITQFIGSPNVEAEKIVKIQEREGNYIIPLHEFSKAAILGDYSHFVPTSSLAMNLFEVQSADIREHFLCTLILGYLLADTTKKDRHGFVTTYELVAEMQNWSLLPAQTENALRRLTNKRLIETTERITFDEDTTGLIGRMPDGFRQTTVGAYHMRRWIGSFAYLDAMVFDTPVFDPVVAERIGRNPGSFEISERLDRTVLFRNYLTDVWDNSRLSPSYFDWRAAVRGGEANFEIVAKAVARNKRVNEEIARIGRPQRGR